jgi:hypothetical protein
MMDFTPNKDEIVKSQHTVTPAKAGVYKYIVTLDSGFRRNDVKRRSWNFYQPINKVLTQKT